MANIAEIEKTMRVITDIHARYDVDIHFARGACCTNGKSIFINAGSPEDEVWRRLVEAKITHEAGGHIRHTDFKVASRELQHVSSTFAGINNIIEDCRVETACMNEFSGAYWVFRSMTYDLIEEGYFQIPDENTPPEGLLFAWLLYSGRGIAVDGQEHLKNHGDFCREQLEKQGLPSNLFDEVEERMPTWANLKDTLASIEETKEVMTILKRLHQYQPPPQMQQQQQGDSSDDQDEYQQSAQSQSGNDSDSDNEAEDQNSCSGSKAENEDDSEDDADGDGSSGADSDSDDDADGDGSSGADSNSDDDADGNGSSGADSDSDDDADGDGSSGADSNSDDDADGNGSSGADSDSDDDADGDGSSGADSDSDDDADGDGSSQAERNGSGSGSGEDNPLSDLDFQKMGECYQDMHDAINQAIDDRAQASPASNDQIVGYNPVPEINSKPCPSLLRQRISEDSRSIRRIIESQMWAKEAQPVLYDDSGSEFDDDLLAGVTAGNNRIFYTEDIVETYKSAFIIAVDFSGSMGAPVEEIAPHTYIDRLFVAQQAALSIATSLEELDVPVAIVYFENLAYLGKSFTDQMNQVLDRVFIPSQGGTETSRAIQVARSEFMKLENIDRKQLLIVTDGMPNTIHEVERQVLMCQQEGIDVASIQIQEKNYGGIDDYKVLKDANELAQVLEDIVRENMLDSICIN